MGTTEEQVVKQKVRKGTTKYLIQTHTLMMMREKERRGEERGEKRSLVSVWFDASGDGRRMRSKTCREVSLLLTFLWHALCLVSWDQSLVGHVICVMLNSPLTVCHFCFLEVNWRDVETRSASRIFLETRKRGIPSSHFNCPPVIFSCIDTLVEWSSISFQSFYFSHAFITLYCFLHFLQSNIGGLS